MSEAAAAEELAATFTGAALGLSAASGAAGSLPKAGCTMYTCQMNSQNNSQVVGQAYTGGPSGPAEQLTAHLCTDTISICYIAETPSTRIFALGFGLRVLRGLSAGFDFSRRVSVVRQSNTCSLPPVKERPRPPAGHVYRLLLRAMYVVAIMKQVSWSSGTVALTFLLCRQVLGICCVLVDSAFRRDT